jgi:hypothetical protein
MSNPATRIHREYRFDIRLQPRGDESIRMICYPIADPPNRTDQMEFLSLAPPNDSFVSGICAWAGVVRRSTHRPLSRNTDRPGASDHAAIDGGPAGIRDLTCALRTVTCTKA